jgi:hypothetical protein
VLEGIKESKHEGMTEIINSGMKECSRENRRDERMKNGT